MESVLVFLGGFAIGVLFLIGYGAKRALGSPGWDDSNVTNFLRLLSHVFLHPEDFGKMWYLDTDGNAVKKPFSYINKDELSEVVDTRP